jgi:hypothetical protein
MRDTTRATTTTIYRLDFTDPSTRADLADALAVSAGGRIVAQQDAWARIAVERGDAARYLEALCEDDDRVLAYAVVEGREA